MDKILYIKDYCVGGTILLSEGEKFGSFDHLHAQLWKILKLNKCLGFILDFEFWPEEVSIGERIY